MLSKTQTYTTVTDSVELTAQVSPCSWMYPGYGLQIQVKLPGDLGDVTVHTKRVTFEDASIDDVNALLRSVRLVKCACGNPAFAPETCSVRAGRCVPCLAQEGRELAEKLAEKEARKLRRQDAKHKAEGYTHRVDAWIHPDGGGDDYEVRFWMKNPTKDNIQAVLKKQGSVQLNDYCLTEI